MNRSEIDRLRTIVCSRIYRNEKGENDTRNVDADSVEGIDDKIYVINKSSISVYKSYVRVGILTVLTAVIFKLLPFELPKSSTGIFWLLMAIASGIYIINALPATLWQSLSIPLNYFISILLNNLLEITIYTSRKINDFFSKEDENNENRDPESSEQTGKIVVFQPQHQAQKSISSLSALLLLAIYIIRNPAEALNLFFLIVAFYLTDRID